MLNPLIERRDYGGYDQIEKQMIDLQNEGLLPEDMSDRIKNRAEKQATFIRARFGVIYGICD